MAMTKDAKISLVLLILGLFFVIFNLVNACLHYNSADGKAQQYGRASLIIFIIQILFGASLAIFH